MPATRILHIEDDVSLALMVGEEIRSLGYEYHHAIDGEKGLELALSSQFQVIILDLGLPGMNGFDICREIREKVPHIRVIVLSSRAKEVDKVLGLELGADDFLTKPFSIAELIARIRTQLRRLESSAPPPNSPGKITIGELSIDVPRRTVSRKEVAIPLTNLEFDLLLFLAEQPGIPIPREELLERVWGFNADGYCENVSSIVFRLRKKIEVDHDNPRYILTVRGVGYRFVEEGELHEPHTAS